MKQFLEKENVERCWATLNDITKKFWFILRLCIGFKEPEQIKKFERWIDKFIWKNLFFWLKLGCNGFILGLNAYCISEKRNIANRINL